MQQICFYLLGYSWSVDYLLLIVAFNVLVTLQLGFDIDGKKLEDLFWRFKSVAEKKKVTGAMQAKDPEPN